MPTSLLHPFYKKTPNNAFADCTATWRKRPRVGALFTLTTTHGLRLVCNPFRPSSNTYFHLLIPILWNVYKNQKTRRSKINLPPGSFGWPFLGESLALLRAHWDGVPERFIQERIEKHQSPLVFKTLLLGERMAVLCGPAGNKFVFGNENKLVAAWWPLPMRKLFGRCLVTIRGDEAKWTRKMLSYLGILVLMLS
ncbi:putative cytochrome P450 superfamily [Helianthus debilis subsp. tardiflorus]